MIRGIDLDHVAIAVEDRGQAWPCLAGELGGRWVSGGESVGFAAAQVRYANGMKVEVLEPYAVEQNDFLRRFLDRSGPGPHHLTFKVPDIVAALDACEATGYRPIAVDLRDPGWKEAFIHPKDAPGVVIQIAQAAEPWSSPEPSGFPPPAHDTATLLRVVHLVADADAAERLFVGLLAGEPVERGDDEHGRWVELRWPGPGRVRLLQPAAGSDEAAWLAERTGRLHHLAFACAWLQEPATVEPGAVLGTRLRCFPEKAAGT
jgi:methylmalonyl-CoA/ethylmalonyl-CoA epimerase